MTAQEIFDQLSMPFPPEDIDWRIGSTKADKSKGLALAYIDARTAMDRLDMACGPANWQKRYPIVGDKTVCEIGIRIEGEWLWRADGAGDTDMEGTKGGLSDAFKRAAVCWGVGRYLYGFKSPWVAIEPYGKSFQIQKDEFKNLEELYEKEIRRIGWGNPTDVATYRFLNAIVQETVTQPSDALAFRETYKSYFPMLRVAMRRHLEQQLDRIGGTMSEAAE
jgi:hypothetical protein